MPEAEKKRAMITSLRYSGACEYANSGPADTKRQKSLWIFTNSPHGKTWKFTCNEVKLIIYRGLSWDDVGKNWGNETIKINQAAPIEVSSWAYSMFGMLNNTLL